MIRCKSRGVKRRPGRHARCVPLIICLNACSSNQAPYSPDAGLVTPISAMWQDKDGSVGRVESGGTAISEIAVSNSAGVLQHFREGTCLHVTTEV